MDGGRDDLEGRVELLEGALKDVSARLAELEAGRAAVLSAGVPRASAFAAAAPAAPAAEHEEAESGAPVANALTLAGRSFLVLGGAFLLRAVTEGGRVPLLAGALLGLAYALVWIGASWRSASRGARASSIAHGLTAAVIAFPLVGESATRLAAFSPLQAALALAAVSAAFCAAGLRGRVALLVWIGVLAGAGTAAGLFMATGAIGTFVVLLLGFYGASLVLRRSPGAGGIEWMPGIAAAAALAAGAWLSTREGGTPEGWAALPPFGVAALAGALVALAVAGAAHDARGRDLMPTDVLQPAGALTVAAGILAGATAVGGFWGLLGIVLSARSPREGRGWIAWLAAAIVLGSSALSGLFRDEVRAFLVSPDALPSASGPAVFAAVAALVAFAVAAAGAPAAPVLKAGPPLVTAALALGAVLALAVGVAPFTSTPAGLALVRTAVLCAGALAAAWTARRPRLATLAHLALPLLAAAGLKLLVEDLRTGQPVALFAAFALYGTTLLIVPRLLRKRRQEEIS